jgi:RNA polymerase sigma-70 factor, ECF subfamily
MDEVERSIEAARLGQTEALGRALEAFRDYLLVVGRRELDPALRAKVGVSDLVQETLMAAQRDLAAFRGRTRREWRAWLRSILIHTLRNACRQYQLADRRSIDREVSPGAVDGPGFDPAADSISPGAKAQQRERERALHAALGRLPANYRQVIAWHHRDGATFEEIGSRLGGSAEAARKVWSRALLRLRDELGPVHDPR